MVADEAWRMVASLPASWSAVVRRQQGFKLAHDAGHCVKPKKQQNRASHACTRFRCNHIHAHEGTYGDTGLLRAAVLTER